MEPSVGIDWVTGILVLVAVGVVGVGGYGVFLIFRALRKYTSRER